MKQSSFIHLFNFSDLFLNKHVTSEHTCEPSKNISYNKSNQSRKKTKKFFDFAIRSDFSFAIIDKISVTSVFFFG